MAFLLCTRKATYEGNYIIFSSESVNTVYCDGSRQLQDEAGGHIAAPFGKRRKKFSYSVQFFLLLHPSTTEYSMLPQTVCGLTSVSLDTPP